MKRTAIYMRVSSERQARDGQSLGFQRNLLLDYIGSHPDLILVDEYMDDGVSGAKYEQRDELQRMLNDVKEGKIDLILFTKLDRFFRSVRHLMNTLDLLDKYNVEWKAIQENHDNVSPTGKLALTIMGAFAEMESTQDSQRIKDAFSHKMSKKEWLNAIPPLGYKIVDKHAVPDENTAPLVREMFTDYIRHGNLSKIVRDYASRGAPRTRRGARRLLKSRTYIGEVHGIEGYVEPIIDRETFDTVQRYLEFNVSDGSGYDYIFVGLVICPVCGRVMCGNRTKHKYARYRCNNHYIGQCAYGRTHSESKIEQALIESYKDDLEKRYLKLKSVKKTDNSQKITSLYRKMDRLKELYVNELIGLDEYKSDLEKYKSEVRTLERPQDTNTEKIEALLRMNVYDIYWTLSNVQKRRLWRSVVKSITPSGETFLVEYL